MRAEQKIDVCPIPSSRSRSRECGAAAAPCRQVREARHHAEERAEDQAGARAVDGGGGGAAQERRRQPDGLHRRRAVEETQATHVVHAASARGAQRTLRAQHAPVRWGEGRGWARGCSLKCWMNLLIYTVELGRYWYIYWVWYIYFPETVR